MSTDVIVMVCDPYIPTPVDAVAAIVAQAHVRAGEVHLDLGSGDGRVCLAFAASGCRSVGCELDEELARKSSARVAASQWASAIEIVQADFWDEDWSAFDIVTSTHEEWKDAVIEKFDREKRDGARLLFMAPS